MKNNILVLAKRDTASKKTLVSPLIEGGFNVATCASCQVALSKLPKLKPKLIIITERLSIDCFKTCFILRQVVDAPIMVTGTVPGNKAWTRLVEVGGDFYLVEPFSKVELVARAQALIRRYENNNGKKKYL